MKILHVIDLISQEVHGGSAIMPYELAQAQAAQGHEVSIYASDYQAEDQVPPPSVELRKFRTLINLFGGIRVTPGMLFADFDKFDIVHMHNYLTFVNLIATLKGRNNIFQAHGSCISAERGRLKPFLDAWGKTILSSCKGYIAESGLEYVQYAGLGVDEEKISNLPVGIDIEKYRKIPDRISYKKHRVLYLGRLDRIKGIDFLIKAVASLKRSDVKLIIAGSDYGFLQEVKSLISFLQIDAEITGHLDLARKKQAFIDADVFVMPSRYEMWGMSFMEALACGVPVILSDKCQASAVLPDYCGESVPLTIHDLAAAINRTIGKPVYLSDREKRREWVSQYSWENIARQSIEIYEGVLR